MTNIERREVSADEKLSHNTTLSYKNIFYKNIIYWGWNLRYFKNMIRMNTMLRF